jgi:hypothetical protein
MLQMILDRVRFLPVWCGLRTRQKVSLHATLEDYEECEWIPMHEDSDYVGMWLFILS